MYAVLTSTHATSISTLKNVLLNQPHFIPWLASGQYFNLARTYTNLPLDGEFKGHEKAFNEGGRWVPSTCSYVPFGQEAEAKPIRQEHKSNHTQGGNR